MSDWPPTLQLMLYLSILTLTWILNVLLMISILCRQKFLHTNHERVASFSDTDYHVRVQQGVKSKHSASSTATATTSNQPKYYKTMFKLTNQRIVAPKLANYFFILSVCSANLISVTTNPPSYIVINWFLSTARFQNSKELQPTFCLLHCSMNTFLCNLAFLHVLCSSLDTVLRLKNPRLYLDSQKKHTTALKIAAPWIVTLIQSVCQFTVSSSGTISISSPPHSMCLINDANFLILRSVISYAVPLIVCVILIIIQIVYLRHLTCISFRNLNYLIQSYSVRHRSSLIHKKAILKKTDSNEEDNPLSVELQQMNVQTSTSVNNRQQQQTTSQSPPSQILRHNCPKHGLISLPILLEGLPECSALDSLHLLNSGNNDNPNTLTHNAVLTTSPLINSQMPDVTNHNSNTSPKSSSNTVLYPTSSTCCTATRTDHRTISPAHPSLNPLVGATNPSSSPAHSVHSTHSPHKQLTWLQMYKVEQLSIGLNMASCIVSIGVWSPLMLASLAHKLCEESPCTIGVLISRIRDFEWWAYSGGLVYPIVYLLLDRGSRQCLLRLLRLSTNLFSSTPTSRHHHHQRYHHHHQQQQRNSNYDGAPATPVTANSSSINSEYHVPTEETN